MSQNLDERLNAVVAAKKANDEAAKAALDAAALKAKEEEDKKAAAKKKWETETYPLLLNVVQSINSRIKDDGIILDVRKSERDIKPAIAQVSCYLSLDGADTNKHLVFNVNAYGKIGLVQLIPHTGPSKDAHIDEMDEERMTDLVIGFLELAMSKQEKKAR
ncbi:hypothetical protein [Roseomonas genomospecies 6]|uniref:Uncharacterized protein n=1 Tax=Roseomonas genomospecies 6 TaxID=214106 RepID=A0A9W7NJ55_9PROT|nr:hypothetical protein [Roseomonas genomospecies 6]KAA0680295.1 hypothetical protein DS843_13335 [Roseomonas genomospecies 6]